MRPYLDKVSTARGSGWVDVSNTRLLLILIPDGLTPPLPRAVLTSSNNDF